MGRVLAIALFIVGVLAPTSGGAQTPERPASLRIRVVDADGGSPLAAAVVGFPALSVYALTDTAGVAVLQVPAGDHELVVSLFGYGDASALLHVEPGITAVGDVELTVAPIEIAGITVEGRSRWSSYLDRRGFYERSRRGFGTQMDRTQIERINAFLPSDLLRRTPGMLQAALGSFQVGGGCRPKVFVDGLRWDGSVDDLPVHWIEGIEMYPRLSGAPVEYAGFGGGPGCGLVLIWLG